MKRFAKFTILISCFAAIISIVAAYPAINEMYDNTFEKNKCIDGLSKLSYKNCKYNFEFAVPNDNWIVWDDKKEHPSLPPVAPELGLLSWSQTMYGIYDGDLPSSFVNIRVIDIQKANFTNYEEAVEDWISYYENDPNQEMTQQKSLMNYTAFTSNWTINNSTDFKCRAFLYDHQHLLYKVAGCFDNGYIMTPILQKELNSIFYTFRFMN